MDYQIDAKQPGPELHLTFHSYKTYVDYLVKNEVKNECITPKSMFGIVDMITFSNLSIPFTVPAMRYIGSLKIYDIDINYNHMIPVLATEEQIKEDIQKLQKIALYVDSIYMVLFKSPLRKENKDRHDSWQEKVIHSAQDYVKYILSAGDVALRMKLVTDSCISDSVNFKETGFGCSANVSKFQLWPNGSVTGCPYSYEGGPTTATTVKEILENIRVAQGVYDFDNCYIPKYVKLNKKVTNEYRTGQALGKNKSGEKLISSAA